MDNRTEPPYEPDSTAQAAPTPSAEAEDPYVRALRYRSLTRFYDRVVGALLKETPLKSRLAEQAGIRSGHRVLDVGCGTGTLTLLVQDRAREATVIGADGDLEALVLARRKALERNEPARFCAALGQHLPFRPRSFDRVMSSLVFHHLTTGSKLAVLVSIRTVLSERGELHILDWGKAQDVLMRMMFLFVQLLDGFSTTTDNVRGRLPGLITESGFANAAETHRERSLLGTLSLYRATPDSHT